MIRKNEFSLRICQQLLIFSYSLYESFHEFFHTNPLLSFQTDYESPMQKKQNKDTIRTPLFCFSISYHFFFLCAIPFLRYFDKFICFP